MFLKDFTFKPFVFKDPPSKSLISLDRFWEGVPIGHGKGYLEKVTGDEAELTSCDLFLGTQRSHALARIIDRLLHSLWRRSSGHIVQCKHFGKLEAGWQGQSRTRGEWLLDLRGRAPAGCIPDRRKAAPPCRPLHAPAAKRTPRSNKIRRRRPGIHEIRLRRLLHLR